MANNSAIEWTDATWNPIAGCTPVSPGCTHCYAATMARRLEAMGQTKYVGTAERRGSVDVFTGVVRFDEEAMSIPLRRKKPTTYFVNSMSDLFHESVPDEWVDWIFAVMASRSMHTFQVLTKRPERMLSYMQRLAKRGAIARERYVRELRDYHLKHLEGYEEGFALPSPPTPELRAIYDSACEQEKHRFQYDHRPKPLGHGFSGSEYHWRRWPLSNVWLGVSVEDQQRADERIPELVKTPSAVRFLSCEPLLGPIRLPVDSLMVSIDWVIVGGESGPGARPMKADWARSLRNQCRTVKARFFFKQWGEHLPFDQCAAAGVTMDAVAAMNHAASGAPVRVGKKAAGRLLDGELWNEFPQPTGVSA